MFILANASPPSLLLLPRRASLSPYPPPPSLSHYFCPSRETTLFLLHPSFPHFPSTGFLDNPQTSLPTTVCAFFFFLFSFFYASFHQPFPVSSNSLNTPLALRIPFHRVPALPPISQHPSSFSKISLHEYRYPWYFRSTEGVLSFLNFYPPPLPPSPSPKTTKDSRGFARTGSAISKINAVSANNHRACF